MNHCDPRQSGPRRNSKSLRNTLYLEPLKNECGLWVFRAGKKLSAADTDNVLRDIRQQRDRRNRGDSH
jgi:hypothetical protein